jgi:hypothetical protein
MQIKNRYGVKLPPKVQSVSPVQPPHPVAPSFTLTKLMSLTCNSILERNNIQVTFQNKEKTKVVTLASDQCGEIHMQVKF